MARPVNGDATDTCAADPGARWDCRGEPVCLQFSAAGIDPEAIEAAR